MQRRLILHIGRHKTGTTSLQRFFATNDRALLDRYGILYPATGRANHAHHPLFRADADHGVDPARLDALRAEVEQSGASTVLISAENLSQDIVSRERLRRIGEDFAGGSIDLIVYLRRQDDFLESSYAEIVKRGGCTFPQGIFSFDFELDHRDFLRKYADVFGERHLIVRPYLDDESFDIYRDFMGAIGCTWSESLRTPERRLNTRLPWLYIELLRFANLTPPTRRLMHRNVVRRLFVGLGKRFPRVMDVPRPLSRDAKSELMRGYEASNGDVARLYLSREELFAPPPSRPDRVPRRVSDTPR